MSGQQQTFNVEDGIVNPVTVKVIQSPSVIEIEINGSKYLARVSTGNGISFCHQKVLADLDLGLDTKKDEELFDVYGLPVQTIGQKKLSIMIGNAIVTHDFFVAKDLIQDVLIGCDILSQKFGEFTVDIPGKKLTLG